MVVPVVAQVTALAKGRQIRVVVICHIVVKVGDSQHDLDRLAPIHIVEIPCHPNIAINRSIRLRPTDDGMVDNPAELAAMSSALQDGRSDPRLPVRRVF